MLVVFGLIFLAAPVVLVVGLIRPQAFRGRQNAVLGSLALAVVGFMGIGFTAPKPDGEPSVTAAPAAPQQAPWFQQPIISPRTLADAQARGGRVELDANGCERVLGPDGLDGTAAPLGGFICRPAQVRFADVIERFAREYRQAPNPIVAREIRQQRREALCQEFLSGHLQNWEGTLASIGLRPDGKAALLVRSRAGGIEFASSVTDGTPLALETQIAPGTQVFEQLRSLQSGQRVHFSARLFRGGDDCFLISQASDSMMMNSPAFFALITDIFPLR